MRSNKYIVLFFVLVLSKPLHAGFVFEPYLSYESGVWNQAVESDTFEADMVGASSSVGYGAKLLYAKKRWFYGANFYASNTQHAYAEIDDEDFDDDWESLITGSRTLGSLVGGFQFKRGYIYVGYTALASLNLSENFIEDMDALSLSGNGFSLNATFFVFKRMTLGIEYYTVSYAAPDDDDDLTYGKFNETLLMFNLGFSIGKKSSR